MKYSVDFTKLNGVFTLPCAIADEHIKLAGAVALKVIMLVFRDLSKAPDADEIAGVLGISSADVSDALSFWCDRGILIKENEPQKESTASQKEPEKPKKAVAPKIEKPDRAQVAKRGLECSDIAFILNEAQGMFGRCLRQSEASTLVWLYDDQGMSAGVLMMLIQYAVSEDKCNIGFIERMALDWINSGVEDIKSAEQKITDIAVRKTDWGIVCKAFSIEKRAPSKKEQENAYKWIEKWGYGSDVLKAAYDTCVDTISKFSLPYIDKILTEWHSKGIQKPQDIEKKEKKPEQNNSFGTYDLSKAESLLDL